VHTTAGLLTIATSVFVLLVTWFPLRRRMSAVALDASTALAGAGIALGGLWLLTDVGTASWLVTPPFLALCAIAHRRAMWAGDGPLRT
jgi:hypothetical protein